MNPMQAMANRTARLVKESKTPVYTSSTPSPAQAERERVVKAENLAVTEDFCHICKRATDHFGEHTPEQILGWASRPGMLQDLL